jgi:hypothetical protein
MPPWGKVLTLFTYSSDVVRWMLFLFPAVSGVALVMLSSGSSLWLSRYMLLTHGWTERQGMPEVPDGSDSPMPRLVWYGSVLMTPQRDLPRFARAGGPR